jgi:hypothetical protein
MTGLRIFITPDTSGQGKNRVFYSQRSHGPIYRWHYEEHLDRWHVVRVDALASSSKALCAARWHSVPPGLKAQLSEHYVE